MPPIILSATASRLEKLEKAPLYVPIRIKIPGSKLEITTVMRNPFYADMHGDGFDLSKAVKGVGNAIHKVVPAIDKASDMAMRIGTVSGQPGLAGVRIVPVHPLTDIGAGIQRQVDIATVVLNPCQ